MSRVRIVPEGEQEDEEDVGKVMKSIVTIFMYTTLLTLLLGDGFDVGESM